MTNGLCVALGDFDGVHLGHITIINTAIKLSEGLTPAVYTFDKNCKNAKLITTNSVKKDIFTNLGVKRVIFESFERICNLTPLQFINDILVNEYNVKKIVCGSDFRFGKNAMGNTQTLKGIAKTLNIEVVVVPLEQHSGVKISSTQIREHILNGEMELASKLLSRNFYIEGTVLRGKGLGHKQNTPTVNIMFDKDAIIPKHGVYLTKTKIGTKVFNSITNIGIRPSVENTTVPNAETHILNFNSDVYDTDITVEFIKMLRPEIKFESKEKLFEQVNNDVKYATDYFSGEQNEQN